MEKCKDEIISSKIGDRDINEFEKMFRLYFIRLAKYAYKFVGNTADAQDLTQSVFLSIWELNGAWDPKGTVKSYLYAAVKNQCLNHLKHKSVVNEWQIEQTTEPKISKLKNEWEQREQEDKLKDAINVAIKKMPDKRREVFELSRVDGLTYSEISLVLGITKKTVENHMGNALKFLKEELNDYCHINREIPKARIR